MKPNEPLDDQAFDTLLGTLMESLPMSTNTPENLRTKLIDLAASPAPRHRAIRRPLFVLATGAITVAVAVALMTALPATAKSWEGIKKAAQSISRMNLTVTDAKGVIRSRTFVDPQTITVQLSEGDWMHVNDKLIRTYDVSDNLVFDVVLAPKGKGPDVRKLVLGELSMSTILTNYESEFGTENIRVGSMREAKGRKVYDVTLRDPKSQHYGNVVVDADSDLPIALEVFGPVNGKMGKMMELTARFGLFDRPDVSVPKGAKHQSIAIEKFMEKNGGILPKLNFSFRRLVHG